MPTVAAGPSQLNRKVLKHLNPSTKRKVFYDYAQGAFPDKIPSY